MPRGQNTAGHPGRRVHRERFELGYSAVPALTRAGHSSMEAARARPVTGDTMGGREFGSTPARRDANVLLEGRVASDERLRVRNKWSEATKEKNRLRRSEN